MKGIWEEYEVDPSLNFVMVGDLYPDRGTRPTHGGDVLRTDNEHICLFTAIECDGIPSIYII